MASLGPPETEDGLNSHFPFLGVKAVIPAVGFICIHGGMGAADVGEVKWLKVLEGAWSPDGLICSPFSPG